MRIGIGDILSVLKVMLAGAGFSKRAGQVFTVTLGDDCLGWLGVNYGIERQIGIRVNPVIGVRHRVVEQWVARLCHEKLHPYQPPTVSRPLTALMSCQPWFFSENDEIDVTARQLAEAVLGQGMSFMLQTISLESLLERIEHDWGFDLEYRRPVVLALLGEFEKATSDLERSIGCLGSRGDAAASRFRSFAEAFHNTPPSCRDTPIS